MKIIVNPNEKCIVYLNSKFYKMFDAGVYTIHPFFKTKKIFYFPTIQKLIQVTNQEILTKDNVALRLSFSYNYRIIDPEKLLENSLLNLDSSMILYNIEQNINNSMKIMIREKLSEFTIYELNEKRKTLFEGILDNSNKLYESFGIKISDINPVDISFPKNIQDIFAKLVEAKVRAQTDLENARTQVASARALKNAAEILKGDKDVKYLQFMELISRIASKGNHSFVIGTEHIKID